MEDNENNILPEEREKRNYKFSFITIGVILLIALGAYLYIRNVLPSQIFNQGKKYLEIGSNEKAFKMFTIAANVKPYDPEPVYYQALALSKLPPTYENQKALYEISQLDDCEEASNLADKVLGEMRKQLEKQIGSNYADNVLYEDQLIRWNNSKPITYFIYGSSDVSQEYFDMAKRAFQEWQTAVNGIIMFKEASNNKDANIVINFVDDISEQENYDSEKNGYTVPRTLNNVLQKADIYIRPTDSRGNRYNADALFKLTEHEIGHALGLWGHSANQEDIMNHDGDYIKPDMPQSNITNRDINTLTFLYKMIPDVIDVPIPQSEYTNMLCHEVITTYPGENFDLEIERLISQLKNDRKNIIVWVDLAINYAYKKQYIRSNHILNQVLPLVNTDFQNQYVILYNLAANYYRMKNYKEAEKYLDLAKTLNEDLDTQILEAFIDYRLGRTSIAKSKLKLLNIKYPENIEVSLKLADIYYSEKDKQLARTIIDNLIKANPKAIRDKRILKYKSK